jgi:hypothetical protein
MNLDGKVREDSSTAEIGQELATKMYETMVKLQSMDQVFYDAQRQVRIIPIFSSRNHPYFLLPELSVTPRFATCRRRAACRFT